MSYSEFIVICALSIACVGRCLTPPASSKVDVAFQRDQGSGLALIYGSIKGFEVLEEIVQTELPDVCLHIEFSQGSELVHQDKCFAPSQLTDVHYHIIVPDRTAQSEGLPILGMVTAYLTSSFLAGPASYATPIASPNTAVRVDLSFEGPLAQSLALAAAQRQQHSKPEQDRQPTDSEQAKLSTKPASSDATTGDYHGLHYSALSAAEVLTPVQHASTAPLLPGLTLQELALGCLQRILSADYRHALLQCKAGGTAARRLTKEPSLIHGSYSTLWLCFYVLLLAIQVLVLHCWHKMAVRGSMDPNADSQATGRQEIRNRQHHINDQAFSEKAKTTAASGASLVTSLHAHSSPHAAQGSRQCVESPLQHSRDRSRAQATRRQSLSGDISRWEQRDVKRSATAPQWQRAGSRLQRTLDDEPEPFSVQQ